MADETLPIPLDIPWKLAASTQQRHQDPYDPFLDSSISLFYYAPKTENLATDYPDERVIYLKAVVTIYPAKLPPEFGKLWIDPPIYVSDYLVGLSGVWHALFDVKVTPDPDTKDLIRPYFHAAAPTNREMIQTGVIGSDQAEGSSNSVAVGKSATELHETIFSSAYTKSEGGSFDIKALSYSKGATSTDVFTDRTLNETVDTTSREASQERRELLSHHTDISNVLSLLSSYHIGSPYTRFSLWPRPISLLSLDAGDPNLWYMELLRHRSSGLEGIQEFFLVLVVPKNQDFCIEADLRRFFVADKPPTPPKIDWTFGTGIANDVEKWGLVTDYLFQRFPRGTPLDELDLDVKVDPKVYPCPAVDDWWIQFGPDATVWFRFASPPPWIGKPYDKKKPDTLNWGVAYYKTPGEVFLEATIAKYEQELARSPLERGITVMMPMVLTTCYTLEGEQPLTVKSYNVSTPPPIIHSLGPPPTMPTEDVAADESGASFYGVTFLAKGGQSPTRGGRAAVARWNQLQRAFSRDIELTRDWSAPSMDLSNPRMYDLFLSAAANLGTSDPRNVAIAELAQHLPLPTEVRNKVSQSGLATLRDLARYLKAAPVLESAKERSRTATDRPSPATPVLPIDSETRELIADAMRRPGRASSGDSPPRGGPR